MMINLTLNSMFVTVGFNTHSRTYFILVFLEYSKEKQDNNKKIW